MTQLNSPPNRLYTRFITMLKFVQYLGYFLVVVFSLVSLGFFVVPAGAGAFASPVFLILLLLQVGVGCLIVYLTTQGLIAVVDLLSHIEYNTRIPS